MSAPILSPRDRIIDLAKARAGEKLDWRIVAAIIEQESGFDPWAVRYEPAFYDRYIYPISGGLTATEARLRAFSWGLMQVMGQTAREHGYTAPLPKLCEPDTGISVGCTVLERKLNSRGGDVRLALLAYNGGARPAYVDEVLGRMEQWA